MDSFPLYQGNTIFRNQPPYTIFNKTFEEAKDVLYQQIEEINPIFLSEVQLKNTAGFMQQILLDPRTKKEQIKLEYDHSVKGKRQKSFKGGGIKSSLTIQQHKVGLRVLLAQQSHEPLDEADAIVWHQFQTKLQKERRQMHEFIREFEEAHKEEICEPTKRLDELYRAWFKNQGELCAKLHPDNIAYNTHIGLPLVSLCKTINGDPFEISNAELLLRQGHVRLYKEDFEADWQNLNFRLSDYANSYNECQPVSAATEFVEVINAQLSTKDDKCTGQSFYLPLETLLFLLTAGDIDLPTEVLLEIKHLMEGKVIAFDNPLPAHNCGHHTHQQVVQQCFTAFMSARGRAKWLHFHKDDVQCETEKVDEVNAGGVDLTQYVPQKLENFFAGKDKIFNQLTSKIIKQNTALLKWYLRSTNAENGLKILTTLELPPATGNEADKFLACEFIKLESKPQFGCELFTKHELLKSWLQMRLMSFIGSTDHGICYHLSTKDLSLQLKQRLTIQEVEQALIHLYRVNPNQLLTNLAEFLKLLVNMPNGKYMLRYTPKYADKFLLCVTSQEITQNTVFLHSLFEAEPTNLTWMTQQCFLPISETLCSAVHLDHQILPCAFLPQLPGQKNLETADIKMKRRKNFIAKIASNNESQLKEQQMKARKRAAKRRRRSFKAQSPKKKGKPSQEVVIEEDLCRF